MGPGVVAGLLGITQGVRHALEPDHLAAVSTLAQERAGVKGGFLLGATWGLGHTASLLVVGGSLAVLDAQLTPRWEAGFELLVAVMLVGLGVRAVLLSLKEGRTGATHTHAHGGEWHTHAAPVAHVHAGKLTFSKRPLMVGLVHGLAGSGALSALVVAELPDAVSRLAFIGLFGLGSVVGMALLTAALGTPLERLKRAPVWAARLLLGVGVVSVALGVFWGAKSALVVFPG